MKDLKSVIFLSLLSVLLSYVGLDAQGWQQYGTGALPAFNGLSAVNDSVCWFAGDNTLIVLSQLHYNGNSYAWCQNGLEGGSYTAIYGRSSILAYTGSADGKIYKTTNGGSSWKKQFTQSSGTYIDGIYFWTDSVGIAYGDPVAYPGTGPFTIIRTTDGGTTWNDISSTLPSVTAQYGVVSRFDAVGTHFWFPSANNSNFDTTVAFYLFHSRDRGLTWEKLNVPANFDNFMVAFSDTSNGLITDYHGKTARTTDGGNTWSVKYNSVGFGPLAIQKGTGNVWVQGNYDSQSGTIPIFYSTDFGTTWGKQPGNSPAYIFEFSVASQNVVWACGGDYLMLRNSIATVVTSIASKSVTSSVPASFELSQNYPNPFNPTTTIKYHIEKAGNTKLMVYDLLGRNIRTLVNDIQSAGWHTVIWNGTNEVKQAVATGTYFYRIENNGQSTVKKMLMLK